MIIKSMDCVTLVLTSVMLSCTLNMLHVFKVHICLLYTDIHRHIQPYDDVCWFCDLFFVFIVCLFLFHINLHYSCLSIQYTIEIQYNIVAELYQPVKTKLSSLSLSTEIFVNRLLMLLTFYTLLCHTFSPYFRYHRNRKNVHEHHSF